MSSEVLGNAVIPVRAVLDKLDADLDAARSKVVKSTKTLGDQLKPIGLALGAALGGALGIGFLQHLDVEAANAKLAAQLNLSGADAKAAGKVAGRLYADAYGESLEGVTAAVGATLSSLSEFAASDADIERLTARALDLSKAFGFDVQQTSQLAGEAIRHGLAGDADEAFDLITASMQTMPAHMRDELFPAISEYGDELAAMGFTGEEAFGLLAEASRDGMFGIDKTGDAIKELGIRATDMSATSVEAYKAAGLSAEDMSARFLAGGSVARGALGELIDGLQGIDDPVKRANAAIALFGGPIEDLGVTQIPEFLASLEGAGGALGEVEGRAAAMGETLNDTTRTSIESFKRGAEQKLVGVIEGRVLPALDSLPGPATEVAMGIAGIGGSAVASLAPLGQMTGGFRGLGGQLGKVPSALAKVAKASATGISSLATMGANGAKALASLSAQAVRTSATVAVQVGRQVGAWALLGAQALAHAARVALAWAISMGPILLVGAAVAGLVALVVTHWGTITRVTAALWDGIKRGAGAAWDWITGKVGIALGWLRNAFMTFTGPGLLLRHWDTIKTGAGAAWDWITGKVRGFISFFAGIPGSLSSAARGMWDWVWTSFRSVLNRVIDGWNSLSFKLPSFAGKKIAGKTVIPGWEGPTLSVPKIPRMAMGGSVVGAGIVELGEWGRELVHLPAGAEVMSHRSSTSALEAMAAAGGTSSPELIKVYVDGRELFEVVRDRQADNDARNGRGRRLATR